MKKSKGLIGLVLSAMLMLTACGGGNAGGNGTEGTTVGTSGNSTAEETTKLVVGATALPHAEMLNQVKDTLAEQGIELEVKEFADYTLINTALAEGELDANFFQHLPYLESYVEDSGTKLVSAGGVHIEPMGIYSDKITDMEELSDGAKVSIPNDATNEGRALLLLEDLGYIKLNEEAGLSAMPSDIIENEKGLQFVELDAAQLPRTLSEVEISVINTNYALEADLNPTEDALEMEGADSPYVNIIAVREGDENKEAIKALYSALTTEDMRSFILENYEGVVPAF